MPPRWRAAMHTWRTRPGSRCARCRTCWRKPALSMSGSSAAELSTCGPQHTNRHSAEMNCLFIHQNFPGQYVHIARHLAEAGHQVVFVTQQQRKGQIPGVRRLEYRPASSSRAHAYLGELGAGVANGLAIAELCERLKREGFTP